MRKLRKAAQHDFIHSWPQTAHDRAPVTWPALAVVGAHCSALCTMSPFWDRGHAARPRENHKRCVHARAWRPAVGNGDVTSAVLPWHPPQSCFVGIETGVHKRCSLMRHSMISGLAGIHDSEKSITRKFRASTP